MSVFQLSTVRSLLREVPINLVDVGAAGGIHPLFKPESASGLFRYFGFEANPQNFSALPEAPHTQYFQVAVSNKVGRTVFHSQGTVGSIEKRTDRENQFGEGYTSIEVDVESLSNLRTTSRLPAIDILKTDVERHDFSVLVGLEDFSDEPLCAICEYEYYSTDAGSFSDIDKTLTKNGMLLFSLAQKNGPLGELAGGDLLYFRDVGDVLARGGEEVRAKVIKLFTIAAMLNYTQYAFAVIGAAREKGVLTEAEYSDLSDFCRTRVFLPFALPRIPGFRRLAHIFTLLGVVASGSLFGAKSAPRFNRLSVSSRLFLPRRLLPPGWRRRYDLALDRNYKRYSALRGVFFRE